MNLATLRLNLNWARRIHLLALLKWPVLALPPLLVALVVGMRPGLVWVGGLSALAFVALRAWEASRRRQFIREARFPPFLASKLRSHYPQLSQGDADLVLRGLRQFFLAHLRSKRRFVSMPSQVVDAAWHDFILHTRAYASWCEAAFGRLLHHTPAEVLGDDARRNDGLRRAWFWACKEESIDPRTPTRLPLLFALDKKFGIPGGFSYVPDCRDIERQSGSDAYCGSSFGDGGSGASGDADGFGGSDASSSHGSDSGDGHSGSSDGDSGGCGGGCGGD
jgi:hypothetical protein